MQQVRLWEVTPGQGLEEIPARLAGLEERLETWLADDISVLDPSLIVIGRQVHTDYGGIIDLLCLDVDGNLVVIELKRGQTPREVTTQILDYSSWAKHLPYARIMDIADRYLGGSGQLQSAFEERLQAALPEQLNQGHRALIVAESIDESTDRIVRYLAELGVPINVATVQHFQDADGRELLAQVYLVEPEAAQPHPNPTSRKSGYSTVNGIQALADENGIGGLYRRIRDGVRGIFQAQPYGHTVGYLRRLENGGVATFMFVRAIPAADGGVGFTAFCTRFREFTGIDEDELRSWLPDNIEEEDLKIRGSAPGERAFPGSFRTAEEVDKFITALRGRLL